MQLAGHTVGQSPHATHFALPSSVVSMRCVPRQRGEMLSRCSGYCVVTLWGSMRCLKVLPSPFSVART